MAWVARYMTERLHQPLAQPARGGVRGLQDPRAFARGDASEDGRAVVGAAPGQQVDPGGQVAMRTAVSPSWNSMTVWPSWTRSPERSGVWSIGLAVDVGPVGRTQVDDPIALPRSSLQLGMAAGYLGIVEPHGVRVVPAQGHGTGLELEPLPLVGPLDDEQGGHEAILLGPSADDRKQVLRRLLFRLTHLRGPSVNPSARVRQGRFICRTEKSARSTWSLAPVSAACRSPRAPSVQSLRRSWQTAKSRCVSGPGRSSWQRSGMAQGRLAAGRRRGESSSSAGGARRPRCAAESSRRSLLQRRQCLCPRLPGAAGRAAHFLARLDLHRAAQESIDYVIDTLGDS